MTECIQEESLELDEDIPPIQNWLDSSSRIDYSSVYGIEPSKETILHKYPKLVPVITTRDLDWYQHIVYANDQKLINGFDEIMVNIYGECSSLFDYQ